MIDKDHALAARKFRAIMATYADVQDLIRIGAYVRGSSPQVTTSGPVAHYCPAPSCTTSPSRSAGGANAPASRA